MRRGQTDASPAFPEIEEQLGYNPARFLVPTDHGMDELSWQARVKAFIRGMDDVETIRAWQHVENTLGQGPNSGPRQQVINWLNQRKAAIEGRAISDDGTAHTDAAACDETTKSVDKPGTPTPANEERTATAVAADGGATSEATPRCPECHSECTREKIADKIGYWCPACGEFREPVTTEART